MNEIFACFRASRSKAGLLTALLLCAGSVYAQPFAPGSSDSGGDTVYTMTNAPGSNTVLAFHRAANGLLTPAGTFATGGAGTGSGLGSQGSLAWSDDGEWLIAVNAGSNDITVFQVTETGLVSKSRTPSGGTTPISVTLHDNRIFVLNAGGKPNISGFRLRGNGTLHPMHNAQVALAGTNPAEVLFNRSGEFLVVTEKGSNSIAVFATREGHIVGPIEQTSHGTTPFGFTFDRRDHLLVTEANGGPAGTSTVSSYDLSDHGALTVISGSVGTTQASACWIVTTRNGRYAFTANTAAGTLSQFSVAPDGTLTLDRGIAANNGTTSRPGDLALSQDSSYLYSLNPGTGAILEFHVNSDGSLTSIGSVPGIAGSAVGLVAR